MKRQALALTLPPHWTPEQAAAVFEILDELGERVWRLYGPQIQQAMREERCTTSPRPRGAIDQRGFQEPLTAGEKNQFRSERGSGGHGRNRSRHRYDLANQFAVLFSQ